MGLRGQDLGLGLDNKLITRSDKLLSLFSVVQFTNSECVSDEDDTRGVCVTANEVSLVEETKRRSVFGSDCIMTD